MKIKEAIAQIDALKPNSYSQSDKIKWLSMLDGMVKRQIIDTHEGGESVEFNGYNDDTPLDTELLIYAPYDETYIDWLSSKIDFANEEFVKYNNSIIRFNDTYSEFQKDYNRTHMPKARKFKFW